MKKSLIKKTLIIFAVLVCLWVAAAPLVAAMLISERKIDRPDAILVLAGSAVYRERTAHAAGLFRQGVAPLIVLTNDDKKSGWSAPDGDNPKFVELARRELIAGGVPEERIRILETKVTGTIVEARLLVSTAGDLGIRRLLLVTSSYHSARALRTFDEVAVSDGADIAFGMSPVPTGIETPSVWTWWLSLRGWRFVVGEYVKSVYYETLL